MHPTCIHRLLLCLLTLAGVGYFGPLLAGAEEPIAVITELKPNRGEVHIRLPGKHDWERPGPLQSLYEGSQIRASKDALVVILFMDGVRSITVEEKNSPYELRATVASQESGTGGRLKEIASFLLGKKKLPTYVPLAVRGAKRPLTPLSPRNTKLLSTAPTFYWMATGGIKSALLLYDSSGLVWKEELAETRLPYPATTPLLRPGVEYRWALETPGFPVEWASFKTLDDEAASEAQERLRSLQGLELPKTTFAIIQAGFLLSHELFHDGREILTAAIEADPSEPALHLLLGDIYEKTGLQALAAKEYGEAEFLAKGNQ